MSLEKKYLKTKPICKVTFRVPAEMAPGAGSVNLVGEFNGWDIYAMPMQRLKDGSFKLQLDLETDRDYQFRYLIDEMDWENDWSADGYRPTPFGNSENSVVSV
ncbi:MAG: glycoside hydrolase [Deltaproteobacteria bacterium]|nr:glycoside hydrolase [Deltaproteobacteria bacterium]